MKSEFQLGNIVVVVGNGLSIDLIEKCFHDKFEVDLTNFFKHGSSISVPPKRDKESFLSDKYLPFLWSYGARSDLTKEKSDEIFETLITLVSIWFGRRREISEPIPDFIYAYQELLYFIRYKMIYYYEMAKEKINYGIWPWVNFLKHVSKETQVTIVTYNYDIWLEEALEHTGIPFYRTSLKEDNNKNHMPIIKPHGSIDLRQDVRISKREFPLGKQLIIANASNKTLEIPKHDLHEVFPQVDLIPPSASAMDVYQSPMMFTWWCNEHDKVIKACSSATHVIFLGLSYNYWDRSELNSVISALSSTAKIHLVNPSPPKVMQNILASLFPNSELSSTVEDFVSKWKL
ncbi:MAG: SIR2 family protein [Deltaproteobacteria bacterium]|nr:SIR2 family protein [Deltaproteobacteria bacterium]